MTGLRRLRLAMALWWVWRRCDWVYRFAHHPLCGRFHRDVWRFGRVHLCRSCMLFYGAGCLALAGCAWLGPEPARAWPALWGVLGMVLPLCHPGVYRRWPRWMRDVLRGGMGVGAGLLLAMILLGQVLAGLAHLAALVLVFSWYQRARRPLIARACQGCPELDGARVCTGFALQAQRVMDYEPLATELVIRSGYAPIPPTVPTPRRQ
jgi:hypothetical protein